MTTSLQFLSGGGEMGASMRAHNWDSSMVGPVAKWPQSLRTTLGIVLDSKFPMFLFWGPHHICFYNDAYRPSLGADAKHHTILGMKGEAAYLEKWHTVKPLVEQVLRNGESAELETQLTTICRNGQTLDVYLTYSYSPVKDESSLPAGVLVLCTEAIKNVNNSIDSIVRKTILDKNNLYEKIVGKINDAVLITEADPVDLPGPKIVFVNEAFCTMTGYTPEEVIGKTPRILQGPKTGRQELEKLKTAFGKWKSERVELINYRKDGTEFAVEFEVVPVADEKGWFTHWISVQREVTDRRDIQEKLEISEAFNRTILESSNDCLKVLDLEGRIQYMNANALCQMDLDDFSTFRNTYWVSLWGSENEALVKDSIAKALAGQTAKFTAFCPTAKGIPKWWDVVVSPAGKPVQKVVAVSRDITEAKEAAEKIKKSEAMYRGLFESMDQGLSIVEVIFDETNKPIDYRFIENNAIFQQQTGLPDITNKTAKEVMPDLGDFWFDTYGNVALTGQPIRFTKEAKSLNRWFDVYAFRLGGQGSNTVVILFTNITERKQAEQKLAESEAFNRNILESSPDCLQVLTMEGRVEYMNRCAMRQLDVDDFSTVQNKYWWTLWGRENETMIKESVQKALAGETAKFTAQATTAKGTSKWWDVMVSPVGQPVQQIISVSRDITLSREESDSFNFTVSHDLRTPLSSIKSYAELLLLTNESLDDDAKKMLGRIEASADKMALLLKEILNYSSYARDEVKLEKVDVKQLLAGAKADIFETLPAQNLKFIIGSTPDITGDTGMIGQVFANLLGNAVKYSSKSDNAVIKVEGCDFGYETIYTVADNGIGIDIKYQSKVFELFKRMDNVKEYEGTGVGLAIVKRIMDKHHGRIWFESQLGIGTTFFISFKNEPAI